MTLTDFADLFLYTGLLSMALAGVLLIAVCFEGPGPTILTSKKLRKIMVDEYRNKTVALGGMLGLMRIMVIAGVLLIAASGFHRIL